MKLYCQNGKHEWERNGRGRPPAHCPAHAPIKDIKIHIKKEKTLEDLVPGISVALAEDRVETLHCEHDEGHEWQREVKRGRKPRYCPEHAPAHFSSPAKSISSASPSQRASELISEILSDSRAAQCHCGIRPEMSNLELRQLRSCCDPQFICPTLDTVRRRLNI